MGAVFRFKQFEVDQTDCAMKINTDGVLLGAIERDVLPSRILDIGTGTGVVALMLAQMFPDAIVDAVEMDDAAATRAQLNFAESPFTDRLTLFHKAFQTFVPSAKYNLIVSNPPFYTNSLHTPDERKRLAKHTDTAFFDELLAFVAAHLTPTGLFECIVPPELADWLIEEVASKQELYVRQLIDVSSFVDSAILRRVVTFGRRKAAPKTTSLYIYEQKGIYASAYKQLLTPYFLNY